MLRWRCHLWRGAVRSARLDASLRQNDRRQDPSHACFTFSDPPALLKKVLAGWICKAVTQFFKLCRLLHRSCDNYSHGKVWTSTHNLHSYSSLEFKKKVDISESCLAVTKQDYDTPVSSKSEFKWHVINLSRWTLMHSDYPLYLKLWGFCDAWCLSGPVWMLVCPMKGPRLTPFANLEALMRKQRWLLITGLQRAFVSSCGINIKH